MAMASGEQLKNAKIAVLDLINKNKEILFGKLSDILTREIKESKWAEVADHAHVLGAFPWHRTWDYLRDTTWQNWRKRFVEKREKKDKYDVTGQGPRVIYDEADLLIMEILEALGKSVPSSSMQMSLNNSSIISNSGDTINDIHEVLEIEMSLKQEGSDVTDGVHNYQPEAQMLGLDEGDASTANNFHNPTNNHDAESSQDMYEDEHTRYRAPNHSSYLSTSASTPEGGGPLNSQPKIVSTSSLAALSRASILRKSAFAAVRSSTARKRPASSSTMALNMESAEKELAALKCRKIRAELDLLHRETYKKDLEIFQLERALGLPASDLTRKFYRFARNNHSIINNLSNR